jgi:hypothetical protein
MGEVTIYGSAGGHSLYMTGYDDSGAVIDTATASFSHAEWLPLSVSSSEGIRSVMFNANHMLIFYAFDDLSFTRLGVPEPSTLALLAFGLLGLAFFGWRRKH